MKPAPDATSIGFALKPNNPGQFLACCGLLELAERLWPGATAGYFEDHGRIFKIRVANMQSAGSRADLVTALVRCAIDNVMTVEQKARLEALGAMNKKALEEADVGQEKKSLDSLWRESAVTLGAPFNLTIDWHQDDRGGGSNFKTWAGQQSVIDIARGMQAALRSTLDSSDGGAQLLAKASRAGGMPFNFDADLGAQGAALDVGFSFDPLPGLSVGVRPALELCAFIGLQRFRPAQVIRENRYLYATWEEPLPPAVASAAASGSLDSIDCRILEFRLLYRTKYLKSFLASKPVRGES